MMKKIGPLFLILLLAGCGKEPQTAAVSEPVGGTVSVRLQNELKNESDTGSEIASKTTGEPVFYTFEAWTCDAAPRCVLHETVTGTLTEAAFEIALVPGLYDWLFWADYGNGSYNTSDLRRVSLTDNYIPGNGRDAFAGRLEGVRWNGGNGFGVTLSRPLAKLILRNTHAFSETKPVSVTYNGLAACYDVLTGETSGSETRVIAFPPTTTGDPLVGEDFLFLPAAEQSLGLSVTVGETLKTLDALQLEANYKTNVTATFE